VQLIFRNEVLNRQFADVGYVVLPLLDGDEVRALERFFAATHLDELPPFYVTVSPTTDRRHRKALYDIAMPILQPKLARLFEDVEIAAAFFYVKGRGQQRSSVAMHVDRSFVDERACDAAVFWCPLTDVDPENGCLDVVPGSHRHVGTLRPYGDATGSHPYRDVLPLLRKRYARTVPMKAGEVVIFRPGLLHGSGPNMGPERRVVVGGGITPTCAPLRYSVMVSTTEAAIFEIDKEFFLDFQAGERPDQARCLGTVGHRVEQLDESAVSASPALRVLR